MLNISCSLKSASHQSGLLGLLEWSTKNNSEDLEYYRNGKNRFVGEFFAFTHGGGGDHVLRK